MASFDEDFGQFQSACDIGERRSAVGVTILRPAHVEAALLGGTRHGVAIAVWTRRTRATKRGEGPLCLGCDREFGPGRRKPEAFCIAEPHYQSAPEQVVCTGICRHCARRANDELMATAAKGLIGKSAQPVDEGHA
jgi:hypothetical protein